MTMELKIVLCKYQYGRSGQPRIHLGKRLLGLRCVSGQNYCGRGRDLGVRLTDACQVLMTSLVDDVRSYFILVAGWPCDVRPSQALSVLVPPST